MTELKETVTRYRCDICTKIYSDKYQVAICEKHCNEKSKDNYKIKKIEVKDYYVEYYSGKINYKVIVILEDNKKNYIQIESLLWDDAILALDNFDLKKLLKNDYQSDMIYNKKFDEDIKKLGRNAIKKFHKNKCGFKYAHEQFTTCKLIKKHTSKE